MIGVIAFIAVFIAAYFAYKTANDNGRNGAIWALTTVGVGLGFQIIVPILIGIILAVLYLATGSSVDQLQERVAGPASLIGLVCLFLSFVGIWLVLRHVSKLPDEEDLIRVPPPPIFDQNE